MNAKQKPDCQSFSFKYIYEPRWADKYGTQKETEVDALQILRAFLAQVASFYTKKKKGQFL